MNGTMMTMPECVDAGGHHWVTRGGGIVGFGAEYWQTCERCPAIRKGVCTFYLPDAETRWTEPYHQHEVTARHRVLIAAEVQKVADRFETLDVRRE